ANTNINDSTTDDQYFNYLHTEETSSTPNFTKETEMFEDTQDFENTENFEEAAASQEDDSTYHYSYVAPSAPVLTEKEEKKRRKKMEKEAKKAARKSSGKKGVGGFAAKLIASALVFGLVAGGAFQGFNYCYNKINPNSASNNTVENTTTLTTSGDTIQTTTDVSEVVANVMPSIVSITSVVEQQVNYGFWGQSGTEETEGAGSGIIIGQNDNELLIVTNYHVIEDAKSLSVGFCDSSEAAATIKGTDSDADLAVVSVPMSDLKADTKSSIKVATLGSSSALTVGEQAIAIGNALGYGQSVTVGYISALDREVALTDKTMTLLQTDAAINPGNSGGALLNMKGEVIGINSVKYSDTTVEGMGYAIPIDTASPIIESLMNQEAIPESEQAYLGITGSDVTETYSQQLNLPTGVYVQSVQTGSAAEQGGIYAGDVITKFEGNEISSMESLTNKLSNKKAGDEVTITIQRMNQQGDYEEHELKITLGAKSDM
ncbi:MAG: trypsin-like peptidase domain-containing protein, partial [Lachnospiraceae bacterium]|nr:trypsin-like peptidase domain-containing protein [Lachnospiraceae bacterium]